MGFLKKLFGKAREPVVVVSGLPRSGTSMMMKMLEAGGLEIVTDQIRKPNEDNPKGYYEFERVKKLPEGDTGWLRDAPGKCVKIISALLLHLPTDYDYQVLFMRRKMEEILASQRKMLVRRGEATESVDDGEMGRMFEKHLAKVYAWMEEQPNLEYINVDYNRMLEEPHLLVERIDGFLDRDLDLERMEAVVDPALYRQRR
ncbi:MAG: sulfotransferase family protein [Anaerolineales bacterium]